MPICHRLTARKLNRLNRVNCLTFESSDAARFCLALRKARETVEYEMPQVKRRIYKSRRAPKYL